MIIGNPKNTADQEHDLCDVTIIHQDILEKVKKEITDDDILYNMAEIFKVLSDPTRLKIINALMLSEMCVCDISALLNMSQPAISHHLRLLRQTHLIKYRRDGKIAYYSLDNEYIKILFDQCITYIKE
ncbi:ArsR/SmtB family transcription factor [Megasphaera cerevisiae]|jgi:ArsR family transcriptional regulator|uniref:ArsR/SmtB family transcription factor n=2 Tax=Megasphaera TaxID=906 RepID=UPI00094521B7|nr:metalloregulator ArsR/SmtB family transcription factor [Megasphaera cerevisiae]OKY52669.1 transcriptional regulator [Megasphaera cerevisiae]